MGRTAFCELCGAGYTAELICVDTASGALLCPVHFRRRSLGVTARELRELTRSQLKGAEVDPEPRTKEVAAATPVRTAAEGWRTPLAGGSPASAATATAAATPSDAMAHAAFGYAFRYGAPAAHAAFGYAYAPPSPGAEPPPPTDAAGAPPSPRASGASAAGQRGGVVAKAVAEAEATTEAAKAVEAAEAAKAAAAVEAKAEEAAGQHIRRASFSSDGLPDPPLDPPLDPPPTPPPPCMPPTPPPASRSGSRVTSPSSRVISAPPTPETPRPASPLYDTNRNPHPHPTTPPYAAPSGDAPSTPLYEAALRYDAATAAHATAATAATTAALALAGVELEQT